jgi:molybdenum cofactor guanylyltransferase
MPNSTKQQVTAVILTGGRGRRMGGQDKGLIMFAGQPLVKHLLTIISPQVSAVMINANRNEETYATYGHMVVSDELNDFQGPLAGYSVALQAAATPFIVVLPCDGPNIPDNLVERLMKALNDEDAEIAVAHDGERMQPVYALIKTALQSDLLAFLSTGERKIDRWYAQHKTALADFSDMPTIFHNINTPEQHNHLQQLTQA